MSNTGSSLLDSLLGDVGLGPDASGGTTDTTTFSPSGDGGSVALGGSTDAGMTSAPNTASDAAPAAGGGGTFGGNNAAPAPAASTPASKPATAPAAGVAKPSWWTSLASSSAFKTGGTALVAVLFAAGAGYGAYRALPWLHRYLPSGGSGKKSKR